MTTYRTVPRWTEIRGASILSQKALGYFRARLKNRLHELVLSEFLKLEKAGFTKADMARRISKKPEQITRLLGAPGNWTLDTVSDLLLAMGYELKAEFKKFDESFTAITSSEWNMQSKTVGNRLPKVVVEAGTTASPRAVVG